ncbi:MAG: RseA family anti-sigma factor, partial [Pseudomonadota bacterium]
FHLIGDAMRGNPMLPNDFTLRLRSRLQQEPTVLAPRFHWRKPLNLALSAAASIAAVAVVLTLVAIENPLQPLAPVAIAPKPAMTEGTRATAPPPPAAVANQGRMNEYLIAHQEFSPSTALQGVAPYVRTVSVAYGADGR